jgi:iron complex outermembrane receptor protein
MKKLTMNQSNALFLVSTSTISTSTISPRSILCQFSVLSRILFFTLSCLPLSALAASEPSTPSKTTSPFEIIEVTAQKRMQKVADVSISVSALSGDTLNELGMVTTNEIASQLPGVTISDVAGTPNNVLVSIRGASQNDFGDHNESSSAVYIDDAYIGAIGSVGIQLFDLERVEVLRGPQGTLFGRNATGGLVHFISKKPSVETDGYLDIELGSYDRFRLEGAVGGGNEVLSGRLSGHLLKQDGYIKNRIGEDMISADRQGLRGQLLYSPNDSLQALFKVGYSSNDEHPGATYEHRASVVDSSDFDRSRYISGTENPYNTCEGCDRFGYRDNDGDVYKSDVDFDDAQTLRKINQYTANIRWVGDTLTFVSISDYQGIKKTYEEDCDGSSTPVCIFGTFQDSRQYSQELRVEGEFDDLQWVAGANYLNIEGDYEIHLWSDTWGLYPSGNFDLTTKSTALFGQLEYDLADRWVFTFGGRWTRDSRGFSYVNKLQPGPDRHLASDSLLMSFTSDAIVDRVTPQAECVAMGGTFSVDALAADFGGLCDKTGLMPTDTGDAEYSARLALDHHLSDDTLVYSSFTRGNKGGGYSAPFLGLVAAQEVAYDQEIIHNYELGFKTSLLDGKAHMTGAVFYADYKDYQAFDLKGLVQVIANHDAVLRGGELELLLMLDDGWSFNFGWSLLQATVEGITLPDKSIHRTRLPQAPSYTFNALAHKSWQLNRGGQISAQLDVLFSGSQYFSVANHKTTFDDSYAVGNARLSYEAPSKQWLVSLWVKNLWEEEFATYGFDAAADFGYSFLSYAPPRTAGLTFSYKFN